jgi:Ca2+-binding RTX toxin-like protein
VLTGGAGADTITGGDGNDTLTTGAGIDVVDGGSGDDTFVLAANLTAADQIDGGADKDTVTLAGNYSAGITFTTTTLQNVEAITVAAGNNYNLTLDDATNTTGLTVTASALAAANGLTLDGSAESSAALTVIGGAGADVIKGGAGADVITTGAGNDTVSGNAGNDSFILAANFTAADKIDGGADADTLSLSGNYAAGIVFNATTLTNVETITVADGNSYKFTLDDATNATTLHIDGSLLSATRVLTVIGTAETSAALTATGGAGSDALTGGAGGDTLSGGLGNDTLIGNGGGDTLHGGFGNDTLTGGTGADTFQLRFADTGKDTVTDFKLIEGDRLEFTQILDGAGNDIQDLIDAGFSAVGSAGKCVISWNGGASTLTLTGVGGTVTSMSDLATLLGPQLVVSH